MKKTLFAFSVTVMLSVVLLLGIGLTGCDWFNSSVLGKPSKAEIIAKEEAAAKERAALDSMKMAEKARLDALHAKEREEAAKRVPKPFHIIVGAFEEYQNADRMAEFYRTKGFYPEMFDYGGLRHVSAVAFDTFAEAERALNNLLDSDYCEDAWIYKR